MIQSFAPKSDGRSHPLSELISPNIHKDRLFSKTMLQWLPVTLMEIHHTSCTFISLHFCATSLGLLLAKEHLLKFLLCQQVAAMEVTVLKTLLGCSFCAVKWHSSATHPNQLKGHFSVIVFTIGLIDTASAISRFLEDMFSRINKKTLILTFN